MKKSVFQPDFHYMLDVVGNRRPARLPLYEHIISPSIMEQILNAPFADLLNGDPADELAFFTRYCQFFKEMTYDTVSFEVCITEILPEHGAILGGRPGPIQSRADFERYPWDEIPGLFWHHAESKFHALAQCLPPGMKAIGGVGNGAFEISEDLVGFQYLPFILVDDPELFQDLYSKIGDLMAGIWATFLERWGGVFAICRMGDDLGYRSSTLVSPKLLRQHIFPQYRRIIYKIKCAGKPFLWHSCGNIFNIMDDVIALGIDAKHSNEDAIAPFQIWIQRFNDRIGLLGGIDVDVLCQKSPDEIRMDVYEKGRQYRSMAKGYALGSGNSIPDYVPVEGYLAMVEAAIKIREEEIADR